MQEYNVFCFVFLSKKKPFVGKTEAKLKPKLSLGGFIFTLNNKNKIKTPFLCPICILPEGIDLGSWKFVNELM